jgi:O-antigen/teichoic acid export membrane protein
MLRLLCIVGMLYPLQSLNLNIIKAKGKSALFLWLEIIQKVLIALSILLTYKHGVMSLIYGQVIVGVISYLLNAIVSGRIIKYHLNEQIQDLMPIMLLAFIASSAAYGLIFLVRGNHALLLISQILVCSLAYLWLSKILNISIYVQIKEELKSRLPVRYQFIINIF